MWVTSRTDADFIDALEIANAPFADGSFVSDGPVLAEGAYLFRYVAYDERGAEVERDEPIEAVVDSEGELPLPRGRFGRD